MLYDLLKNCVSLFFNLFNRLLGGKLPPFGSAGVVVEDHDYYLVVELPGNRTVFPGGYMHWKEHPQQTAKREGREETGMQLHIDGLINYYALTSDKWNNMSNISFMYAASVVSGQLHTNVEGRPCWLHESELRARISGHTLTVLDDYLHYRQNHNASGGATLSQLFLAS